MVKNISRQIFAFGLFFLFIGASSIASIETTTNNKKESQRCLEEKIEATDQPLPIQEKRLIKQDPQRNIASWYACMLDSPPYWFSSEDMYLAPCILPTFPSGSDIDSEGNWYVVDYAGGIYQIFYDGYQVFIAPTISLNSLTYDPATGLWYGCDNTYLYMINMTTGATTIVGPLNIATIMIGMKCNLAGDMYGYDVLWTGDSTLYSIDKDTGACTAIGGMGYGFVYAQDCCFDRDNDNGHLYIAGYFNDGSPPALLLCDVTTGQCTIVGQLNGQIEALTFPYGVSNWMLSPRANFSWTPLTPYVGETILFNASTSVDDDGYITLYEWDWNNDSTYDESSAFPTTTHLWSSPDDYTVTLRVTDDTGLTATKSYTIHIIGNPPPPPVIHGPDFGFVNVSYTFTTDPITDPNGEVFYVLWDWGDGSSTGWLGPYPSGSIISASHAWMYAEEYEIRAKLRNNGGDSNWSEPHIITIVEDHPPIKPFIEGPVVGRANVPYNFTVVIIDPEAEQFFFMINWGDGNTTNWLGPYESGEEIIASHAWKTEGNYTILVKAKNIYGEESNSDPFIIQIVELKKTILLGIFHSQSETDDLRILDMKFLCMVPSNSIVYSNVQLVIRQEHRGGFVLRSFIGGIFEATLIF